MTGSVVSAIAYKTKSATASASAPKGGAAPDTSPQDPTELRNADGWSGGTRYPPGPRGLVYRCHHCRVEMNSPSGARKHEHANKHIVLRVDWDDPDYYEWVMAQPGRGTT